MLFDRTKLKLKSITERINNLDVSIIQPIDSDYGVFNNKWEQICKRVIDAKQNNASIVIMIGAHVIRSGVQNYLIDLMKRGYVSCIAMNGAGLIHDFEFALIGATTESVSRYIKDGQFGLWYETGIINDIINQSYSKSDFVGIGEAVGKSINEGNYPHKEISILAAAYKLKIPVTVHIGIGYDIIHEHPNFNGAASGALSYNDFLRFASIIENLEHGVIMNFGSAVMGPEVFLKALSMARNVARQKVKEINNFTTVVCDLYDLPDNYYDEASKDSSGYYFRPWKTMLVRTASDKKNSIYIKGRHLETIPSLWNTINIIEKENLN